MRKFTLFALFMVALCAAAANAAESVPLLSLRGTSLGIGPNYEWDNSTGESSTITTPRQFTVGAYGAKVLFDGDDTAHGFGSTALVGSVVYGIDNKDLRWSLGARWRIWNQR